MGNGVIICGKFFQKMLHLVRKRFAWLGENKYVNVQNKQQKLRANLLKVFKGEN